MPENEGIRLTDLPGIGDRTASRFAVLGVRNALDLLFLLPRAYQDRTNPLPLNAVSEGLFATICGQVMSIRERRYRSKRTLEIVVNDGNGAIILKWFRFSNWLKANIEKKYPPGTELLASGRITTFSGNMEMHHPDLSEAEGDKGGGVVPVYPLTEGLSQRAVRKAVRSAADRVLPVIRDEIPGGIREEYGLPDLPRSIARLHQPLETDNIEDFNQGSTPWHRRIKFGELLVFQLGLLIRKRAMGDRRSFPVAWPSSLERKFLSTLPFELTRAQARALGEIGSDMEGSAPMHRLLQGDVGSGKTLVAFIALLRNCDAGYQSVLMAPTEVLAEQHFRTISPWCGRLGVPAGLLTGSIQGSERQGVIRKTASGEIKLLIGTHALIQEDVEYRDLNLAVVDEQHRFGVLQRLALGRKGMSPHFLVMTATPIPRSLSMVIYGDLDITLIDEMPPGRLPVQTLIFEESDRSRMHLRVSREVEKGGQVYIVYPLVEESEKMELLAAEEMARTYRERIFPHLAVGLLTGRMSSDEKNSVMERFRKGGYQVLVSTTVIEVGVDVPNASLMIVEHAERFGLFQLHQLRGRIGRGSGRATCILMGGAGASDGARKRLQVIAQTASGFEIAEADLRFRGPGDILGVRQAGLPQFHHADPFTEGELMKCAKKAASQLLPQGAELSPGLLEEVRRMWSEGLLSASSG